VITLVVASFVACSSSHRRGRCSVKDFLTREFQSELAEKVAEKVITALSKVMGLVKLNL